VDWGWDCPALTDYLTRATGEVRRVFSGSVTYASLVWESVDWSRFDFVGVDHYRDSRVKERYVDMLQPSLDTGKPVVVTEFGMRTYVGADTSGTLGFGIVHIPSMVLHELPIVGRFVQARLKGTPVRDEELQARSGNHRQPDRGSFPQVRDPSTGPLAPLHDGFDLIGHAAGTA
jgi:hypothetical protein